MSDDSEAPTADPDPASTSAPAITTAPASNYVPAPAGTSEADTSAAVTPSGAAEKTLQALHDVEEPTKEMASKSVELGDWVVLGEQPGQVSKIDGGKIAVVLVEGNRTLWRAAKDVGSLFGSSGVPKAAIEPGDWVHLTVKAGEQPCVGQVARLAGGRINVRCTDGKVLWRSIADLSAPWDDAPKTIMVGGGGNTPPPISASSANGKSTNGKPDLATHGLSTTHSGVVDTGSSGGAAAFGVALRKSSAGIAPASTPPAASSTPRSLSLASRIAQQRQERADERQRSARGRAAASAAAKPDEGAAKSVTPAEDVQQVEA